MKIKRIPILMLLLAAVLLLCCCHSPKAEAATQGYYTYTVTDGKAAITDFDPFVTGKITIPSTLGGYPVTTIDDRAFYNCYNLTSITIPNSVTTIGEEAFRQCSRLTSITIPENVTTIGEYAFCHCSSLTGIWVNANNPNYTSDSKGVLFNKNKTELIQAPGELSGDYTIPDGITTIGDWAFSGCSSLTAVTIPDSVTTIDDHAFTYCDSLAGIWVNVNNRNYNSDGKGVLFNKNKTELIQAPGAISGDYTIPDSVIIIGDDAFCNCHGLTSVTIPDSVTTIGGSAFKGCSLNFVHYTGTQTQWREVDIGSYNEALNKAQKHYEVKFEQCAKGCMYCPTCDRLYDRNGNISSHFTVFFQNGDGTLLSSKTYHYGEPIEAPQAPTKIADEMYTYTFAGWDREVSICTSDTVFTAVYEKTYIDYTITFLNYDGSVISEKIYHYADTIEIPMITKKPDEKIYSNYYFLGWDKDVTVCYGDTVYTAVFMLEYKEYTVQFVNSDGTLLESKTYHYGDKIGAPADPEPPVSKSPGFRFSGWDQVVDTCTGNMTFTATYEYVQLKGDCNGDEVVNDADAMYLLRYTLFPERYPIDQDGDVNSDGVINDADAMYLLRYTLFPDRYPLYPPKT